MKSLVHYPPKLLSLDRRIGYPGAGLKYIVERIQGGVSSYKLSALLSDEWGFTLSPVQIREYYNNREDIRNKNIERIARHAESWL